ncbi:MAG: hypothetical protein LLG20_12620 [Acidobacteriales bacterium]|nr:hypothetical protein [Terriglobales bacterium]
MRLRKGVAGLAVFLLLTGTLPAQQPQAAVPAQPAPPAAKPAPGPKSLKMIATQGEGATNRIKTRSAVQPAVEVRDENEKPVANAQVVFQLPASGPGGVFYDLARTQTARTNERGQAVASGFAPNNIEGRFEIKVTASAGEATTSIVIAQSNIDRPGQDMTVSGKSRWWKPVLILGAAAVASVAIYAARHGSGSTAQ